MLKGVLTSLVLALVVLFPTPAKLPSNPARPQCDVYGGGACPTATATKVTTKEPSTTAPVGGGSTRVCRQGQKQVPCESAWGWWVDLAQCYVSLLSPQPDKTSEYWQGHTDGSVYRCATPKASNDGFVISVYWSATVPIGVVSVDPVVLAEQAVAALQLRPIRMGMVPEDKPGYVGLVGMPVWMWVDTPDPHTYGPATNTASDGSVTVTINAKVAKTLWEMGDGKSVTCNAAGTAYQDSDGKKMSPDCGYSYSKQGTYTIRATTTWDIAWTANTGQSGTIPLTLTATRTVVIGEVQVIVH